MLRPDGQTEVMSDQTSITVERLIVKTIKGKLDKWKRASLLTRDKERGVGLVLHYKHVKVRNWTIQLKETVPKEPQLQIKSNDEDGKWEPHVTKRQV